MHKITLWFWRAALAVYLPVATAYYLSPAGAEHATATTGLHPLGLHIIGLTVLGILITASFPLSSHQRPLLPLGIIIAYGLLLETTHLIIPTRTFTYLDIVANTIGGICGMAVTIKLV